MVFAISPQYTFRSFIFVIDFEEPLTERILFSNEGLTPGSNDCQAWDRITSCETTSQICGGVGVVPKTLTGQECTQDNLRQATVACLQRYPMKQYHGIYTYHYSVYCLLFITLHTPIPKQAAAHLTISAWPLLLNTPTVHPKRKAACLPANFRDLKDANEKCSLYSFTF